MKICGIELKGNDVIIVGINSEGGEYQIIDTKIKKIKMKDTDVQADVQSFTQELYAFFKSEGYDAIAIKGRAKKGKFAGGSVSFKIEGIIQNSACPSYIYAGATMKAKLKNKKIDASSINAYQEEALRAAICLSLESK